MSGTIRYVGKGFDHDGYPCEVLIDSITGAQYLAYSLETHQLRVERHERLQRSQPVLASVGQQPGHQILDVSQTRLSPRRPEGNQASE